MDTSGNVGAFFGVHKLSNELISDAPKHAPPYGPGLNKIHDVMWYKIELIQHGECLFVNDLNRENAVEFVTKGSVEQTVITAMINHNGLATLYENKYYLGRCVCKKIDANLLSVKLQIGKTLSMDVTDPKNIKVTAKLQRKHFMDYNKDDKFIHLLFNTKKSIPDLFFRENSTAPTAQTRSRSMVPRFCLIDTNNMDCFSKEEAEEFRRFMDEGANKKASSFRGDC